MASAPRSVSGALLRYRVMAYVTGVMLLILCGAVVVQVTAHNDTPVTIAGTLHGWLYMIYVITAFDLCLRMRWSLSRMFFVVIAGTIPFLSFVAEHRVVGWVRAERSPVVDTTRSGERSSSA